MFFCLNFLLEVDMVFVGIVENKVFLMFTIVGRLFLLFSREALFFDDGW